MPHPIIEINELTQLIADNLLFRGQRSLVSLACTCRALEEQALSTLWSEQPSLRILIEYTLPPGFFSSPQSLPRPTTAEWGKFRRYASWMHWLALGRGKDAPEEVLQMISTTPPNGVVFSGLRDMDWTVQHHTIPFYRLFLSSHLTIFKFVYTPTEDEISDETLPSITSLMMELETSSLQRLELNLPPTTSPSLGFAISSVVLRCGPSLSALHVTTPLSDAAVRHIMTLPNLTSWDARNGPPTVSDLSPFGVFPQLETLNLHTDASLEWLSFFEATPRTFPWQDSHAPPHRGPCQKLDFLESRVPTPVNAALISPIMQFHALVFLTLESACSDADGCTFSLTDDDVTEIAIALPRLRDAHFGEVCSANSCQTTVSSLIPFSVHCKDLVLLSIHFNTGNIREDLEVASMDPRLNDSPSFSERSVWLLLSDAPYLISEEDVEPVLTGFLTIFPSLEEIGGHGSEWDKLNPALRARWK